jgi:hypothetical protein
MPGDRRPASIVEERLAVFLGPHTARTAVKTFSERAIGKPPDQLEQHEMPRLLAALRPMLRTLLGASQCEVLLRRITEEFEGR